MNLVQMENKITKEECLILSRRATQYSACVDSWHSARCCLTRRVCFAHHVGSSLQRLIYCIPMLFWIDTICERKVKELPGSVILITRPPQFIMPTGSEHVVDPRNAPFNSLELCIERRTLALHTSALPIGLQRPTYGDNIDVKFEYIIDLTAFASALKSFK